MYVCFRDNLATFLKSTNYKYITYSDPSLEFGTPLYPLKVMNALHYIEDQCILCLLLAILIQFIFWCRLLIKWHYGTHYATCSITRPRSEKQDFRTFDYIIITNNLTILHNSDNPRQNEFKKQNVIYGKSQPKGLCFEYDQTFIGACFGNWKFYFEVPVFATHLFDGQNISRIVCHCIGGNEKHCVSQATLTSNLLTSSWRQMKFNNCSYLVTNQNSF